MHSQNESETGPRRSGLAGRARGTDLDGRTDEDLMVLVQDGRLDAFELLVERYKVGVYSLCRQLLGNREDAEEASQDTFLKVFRARELFDPGRRFSPWILKIAGNAARDILRKRQRRLVVNSEVLVLEAEGEAPSRVRQDPEPLDVEEIRQVLQGLSEESRLPLILKYLHGMKNREVAETLGISLSSLKVRLGRAREILHSRMRRRWEE